MDSLTPGDMFSAENLRFKLLLQASGSRSTSPIITISFPRREVQWLQMDDRLSFVYSNSCMHVGALVALRSSSARLCSLYKGVFDVIVVL